MESFCANCVYLTDSAGYMLPHDINIRVAALREALHPDTEIGFHGHQSQPVDGCVQLHRRHRSRGDAD